MPDIEIRRVNTRDVKDRVTTFTYESPGHYRVRINEEKDGWTISIRREMFEKPFVKRNDDDKTVQDYKGDSELYLAYMDGNEVGQLQFEFQEFSKSMRVWDIDVWPRFKRKGVGTALMETCLERAKALGARRIVLETQSSNLPAIHFYKKMGFELIGLDGSHYLNDDIERGEVRLEMALHL